MIKASLLELNNKLLGCYGIIGFLLLWQAAPALKWVDPQFIPPPSEVLKASWELIAAGDLYIHAAVSLQRTLLGLLGAIFTAIPLGFVLGGMFPKISKFLNPLLQLLGQINAFSLFPIFIMLFGIKEVGKLSVIYWSSVWPIFFTTLAGVKNSDPLLIKSVRSMGVSKLDIFFKVILPGAAPSIFTGFRMGASTAFLMLIAAEMLGSSAGLGWLVHNSNMNNAIPRLFVAIVSIALLGMGINLLLFKLEKTFVRWKEEVEPK